VTLDPGAADAGGLTRGTDLAPAASGRDLRGDGGHSAAASVRTLAPDGMLDAATSLAEIAARAEGIKP
jgi:hypothetical protein